MRKLVFLVCALAWTSPAFAAEERPGAEARAKTIAPYLDAQTVVVAYVDLGRLDLDALAAQVVKLTGVEGREAKQMGEAKTMIQGFVDGLKKAGAHEVYVVLSLADLPGRGPVVVVPTPAGADARAIVAELERAHVGESVQPVGQAVVAADKKALERIKALEPVARPQLVKALDATGDPAIQVVVVPSEELRRIIVETLPTLPPEFGGGSTKVLTQGFQWAAVGVSPPPKPSLKVVVQAPDAASAKALHDLLAHVFEAIGKDKKAQEELPGLEKVLQALLPKVEAERLVLNMDEKQLLETATPLIQTVKAAYGNAQFINDLKQIGVAMYNYEAVHRSLPATASFDKDGKPLLSWRVHLLPYLDQDALYKQFHLDEPWDSEHNKKLIAKMPEVYRGPNAKLSAEGKTPFLVPVGENLMFPPGRAGVKFATVTDGTSNTILTILADDEHSVEWTKPDDLKIDPKEPQTGLAKVKGHGYLVGMADGSVRWLPANITQATLYALFTRNGGEVIDIP